MANIVIIGADPSHVASTRLKAVLTAPPFLHTCTLISESSNSSLMGYDLIITTRVNAGVSGYANIIAAFNAGIPLICGMTQNTSVGIGATAEALAGKIGLSSSSLITTGSSADTSTYFLSNEFAPTYKQGDVVSLHQSADFYSYTKYTDVASSAIIVAAPVFPDQSIYCSLFFGRKNSINLLGQPFPAACAFAGFFYSNNAVYSPQASLLIGMVVDKVIRLNNTAVISGYSLNEAGFPELSDVYIYNHADGSLYDKSITKSDGSYSFTVSDGEYFVVCNNRDRDNNPQVIGYIRGVE